MTRFFHFFCLLVFYILTGIIQDRELRWYVLICSACNLMGKSLFSKMFYAFVLFRVQRSNVQTSGINLFFEIQIERNLNRKRKRKQRNLGREAPWLLPPFRFCFRFNLRSVSISKKTSRVLRSDVRKVFRNAVMSVAVDFKLQKKLGVRKSMLYLNLTAFRKRLHLE